MNSIYEPGRQAPRMVAPVDMKADPPLLVPALPAEPPIPAFDDRPPGWPATPSGAGKPLSKPSVRRDAIGGTSADKEGRKRAAPSLPDPDRQSFTGYLPGAPRLASDGLSTFSVDNRSGEQDAVVRLYPNGEKPAVRSFHIKHGQKFTADSMSPGSYVMRYRFIGSNDTFEADKRFILTESETEGGRQFSNVTVTLFRQRDGNLSTRKVAPDEF